MTDRTSKNLSKFPKYGWKVKLDHEFPEKRDGNLKPKLKQIIPLIPMGLRYLKWWAGKVILKNCNYIKMRFLDRWYLGKSQWLTKFVPGKGRWCMGLLAVVWAQELLGGGFEESFADGRLSQASVTTPQCLLTSSWWLSTTARGTVSTSQSWGAPVSRPGGRPPPGSGGWTLMTVSTVLSTPGQGDK